MQGRPRISNGGTYTLCCCSEPYYLDCKACNGRGRTEGIARAIFAAHPITSVTLSDREPLEFDGRGWLWHNRDHRLRGVPADITDTPDCLPEELHRQLSGFVEKPPRVTELVKRYPTPDAALAALSAACVRYGRSLAGIR
jgi:hypothetical protein